MRHNRKVNHLGRQSAHRKALLSNMACSLLMHKRINTTVAKAKALKIYVEPLITKSKEDSTHSRRVVFSYLKDKHAVTELFKIIAPKIGNRPGGYTRILKTGFRLGDAADMCIIEIVDFNETYTKDTVAAAKSRTRRSRGAKKTDEAATSAPVAEGEATAEVSTAKAAPAKAAKPAAKRPAGPKPIVQKGAPKPTTKKVSTAKTSVGAKKG